MLFDINNWFVKYYQASDATVVLSKIIPDYLNEINSVKCFGKIVEYFCSKRNHHKADAILITDVLFDHDQHL